MPDFKTIGQFIIDRDKYVGHGTFGELYQAEHRRSKELAAAKKIYLGKETDWIARVEREVDTLMTVSSHPNIVKYLGHEKEGNYLWLFTELCPLGDLEEYCRKNVIAKAEKFDCMIQICEAIQHLHHQRPPIVHRDLKPGNVLVSTSGRRMVMKLCDFGFAREVDKQAGITKKFTTYCGTEGYMSPELFKIITEGKVSYNLKVDIFSAGIIFHDFYDVHLRPLQPMQGMNVMIIT